MIGRKALIPVAAAGVYATVYTTLARPRLLR